MKKFLLALLVISILTMSMLLVACEQEKEPVKTPATTTQAPVEKEQPKGHVHTLKTNVVEPTCVADGYTENTCTNCNEYFRDSYVAHDPDAHEYGPYTTVVKATCQQPLVQQAVCKHCGDVTEKVGTLANHSYTVVLQSDEATCCEDGWKLSKCQWCEETETVTLSAEKYGKHAWSEWSVHTSNIDSNGNCVYGSKQRSCNYCGYVEVQTLMPHTNPDFSDPSDPWLVHVDTVAPTCSTAGYEIWQCSHCGEIIHMNHTNPTGHTYSEWVKDPHDDHLEIRECVDCHHREEKVVD